VTDTDPNACYPNLNRQQLAMTLQLAEKLDLRGSAPKGASEFKRLVASLKRYPDTKLEFFSTLFSREDSPMPVISP